MRLIAATCEDGPVSREQCAVEASWFFEIATEKVADRRCDWSECVCPAHVQVWLRSDRQGWVRGSPNLTLAVPMVFYVVFSVGLFSLVLVFFL